MLHRFYLCVEQPGVISGFREMGKDLQPGSKTYSCIYARLGWQLLLPSLPQNNNKSLDFSKISCNSQRYGCVLLRNYYMGSEIWVWVAFYTPTPTSTGLLKLFSSADCDCWKSIKLKILHSFLSCFHPPPVSLTYTYINTGLVYLSFIFCCPMGPC